MFTYYLSSLHEYREKNLELSQTTMRAWLDIMAHVIDGQYLIGRAVLHPASYHSDAHYAQAHWERVTVNDHQELMMKWIDESVAKATYIQEIVYAALAHNVTGWSEFGHELVRKLQKDIGPEYADTLQLIDNAISEIVTSEKNTINSVHEASLVKDVVPRVARSSHKQSGEMKT